MIKKRVLVVDDEEHYLNAMKRAFKVSSINNEMNLECVTSVSAALKILNNSAIDIALVDMNMPSRSGSELIDILLKKDKSPYIIIITGNSSVSEAISYLKKGVYDYLSKPINMDELILKLSHLFTLIDKELKIESLKNEIAILRPDSEFITASSSMDDVHRMIKSAKENDFPVLLLGESGTGKEIVADQIHYNSKRKMAPYIKINSAGIVPTLLESEMFGFEKGAFTGAIKSKPGKFELADNGTLFLDEIGDMDMSLQVKLLRTLQDGIFEHIGGTEKIHTDVRIIAATNKNLQDLIKEGKFREDLFYRLNIITIEIPPLRKRMDDIPLLVKYFLSKFNKKYNKAIEIIPEALNSLEKWNYPGNVRELENIVARAFALCDSGTITVTDLPEYISNSQIETPISDKISFNLEDNIAIMEKKIITECLERTKYSKTESAAKLGISRRQLYYKMKKLKIK